MELCGRSHPIVTGWPHRLRRAAAMATGGRAGCRGGARATKQSTAPRKSSRATSSRDGDAEQAQPAAEALDGAEEVGGPDASRVARTRRKPRCRTCGETGHNSTTCSLLKHKRRSDASASFAGMFNDRDRWQVLEHGISRCNFAGTRSSLFEDSSRTERHVEAVFKNVQAFADAIYGTVTPDFCRSEALLEMFLFLLSHALDHRLIRWMSASLVQAGHSATSKQEFTAFLGMMIYSSTTCQITKTMCEVLGVRLSQRCKAIMPTAERYSLLIHHLRGFHPIEAFASNGRKKLRKTRIPAFDALTEALGEPRTKIMATPWSTFALDDRNIQCDSKENPKQTYRPRKAHVWGAGVDCLADSLLRVPLLCRLMQPSTKQVDATKHILDLLRKYSHHPLDNVVVTVDRGYAGLAMFQVFAEREIQLLCINSHERFGGNPFLSDSAFQRLVGRKFFKMRKTCSNVPSASNSRQQAVKSVGIDPSFIISDGPKLGPAIRSAVMEVPNSACRILALAVREYGTDKASNIHRFILVRPLEEDLESLCSTMHAELKKVPLEVKRMMPFFPTLRAMRACGTSLSLGNSDSGPDEENGDDGGSREAPEAIELESSDDGVDSKDGTEDGEDGFFGGDDGSSDGHDQSDGEVIEVQDVSHQSDGETQEQDTISDEVQVEDDVVELLADSEEVQADKVSRLQCIAMWIAAHTGADDELPEPFESEASTSAVSEALLSHVVPLTCGQRVADWFLFRMFSVTGTVSHKVARSQLETSQFVTNRGRTTLSYTSLAQELVESWIHLQPKAQQSAHRESMAIGAENEAYMLDELRQMDFVSDIFCIGLVRSKAIESFCVSADGIAVFKHPVTGVTHLATVEVKTKTNSRTIRAAKALGKNRELVFCMVGDALWFRFIPPLHRSQVLHQVSVLNVPFGIYSVGSCTEIFYVVVVRVPKCVRVAWRRPFLNVHNDLLAWAYSLRASGSLPEPSDLPRDFSENQKRTLLSWFPLWQSTHALRERQFQSKFGMPPVRVFRSLVQFGYSREKGGVDGIDQDLAKLHCNSKLKWEGKVVRSFILDTVQAAVMIYRIINVRSRPAFTWKGIDAFRRDCTSVAPFVELVDKLCVMLIKSAAEMDGNYEEDDDANIPGRILSARELSALRPPKGARHQTLIAFANSARGKTLRLSLNEHEPVSGARTCAVCATRTRLLCTTCNVGLHVMKRNGNVAACFSKWHSPEDLEVQSARSEPGPAKEVAAHPDSQSDGPDVDTSDERDSSHTEPAPRDEAEYGMVTPPRKEIEGGVTTPPRDNAEDGIATLLTAADDVATHRGQEQAVDARDAPGEVQLQIQAKGRNYQNPLAPELAERTRDEHHMAQTAQTLVESEETSTEGHREAIALVSAQTPRKPKRRRSAQVTHIPKSPMESRTPHSAVGSSGKKNHRLHPSDAADLNRSSSSKGLYHGGL